MSPNPLSISVVQIEAYIGCRNLGTYMCWIMGELVDTSAGQLDSLAAADQVERSAVVVD